MLERRNRTGEPGGELPARSCADVLAASTRSIDPRSGDTIHVATPSTCTGGCRRHPDLDVSRAEPVTLAASRRAAALTRACASGARHARRSVCRPQLIECTLIAPNRYYAKGIRMHTILLPLDRVPLVIDIVGRTQRDLDAVEAPAQELLGTLTVTRP